MIFMNEYDIQEAVARFARDPVLGPAAQFLSEFRLEVNRHSDGWPYWSAPVRAAGPLMTLLQGHLYAGMGAYPHPPAATPAAVRTTLRPIKAFMTRRGTAAGMVLPKEPQS